MVTSSHVSAGLTRAYAPSGLASVFAGDGVGDLVDRVLGRALGLVSASFVLEVSVSGQRAGSFFDATLRLVDLLVGHESSRLVGVEYWGVRVASERVVGVV